LLFRLDAFQTSIYFRAMPSGGAVFLYPYIRDRKYASLLFTMGGLIANCIMIAILDYFYRHFQSFLDRQSGVVYAFFWAQLLMFANLLPFKAKIEGRLVGSDGLQFIQTLFRSRSRFTSAATWYLSLINTYYPISGEEILNTSTAQRVLELKYLADQAGDNDTRRKTDLALQRLLESGGLTSGEECLVLDHLVSKAFFRGKEPFTPTVEAWSARLLALSPDAEASRTTRGAVLAEFGHYDEAKSLLERIATEAQDPVQQQISRLYMALAEYSCDNLEGAIRWCWEVRVKISEVPMSVGFNSRLVEIEHAIKSSLSSSSGDSAVKYRPYEKRRHAEQAQ
jgi:hypothetical protein